MTEVWIHSVDEWGTVLESFTKGESKQFFCSEGEELGFVTTKLSMEFKPFTIAVESPGFVRVTSVNKEVENVRGGH